MQLNSTRVEYIGGPCDGDFFDCHDPAQLPLRMIRTQILPVEPGRPESIALIHAYNKQIGHPLAEKVRYQYEGVQQYGE